MAAVVHTLNITGMSCGGCSSRLTGVLEKSPGITTADVSHETASGVITTNGSMSIIQVIELIESAGFSASE
ncbi:MAG: heavy metal-associated domain-containing protein [Candidatus Poseidoniaceae archaeon]|nr:heavy metal-associated domain-containing protein [Candidatus Poseidoniaceae archaeon]